LFAPFQEGGGVPVSLGSCALVEAAGSDVLLNSVRSQAMNTDMFTQRCCDLTGKQIVIVKSAQHFYASYAPLARRVLYVTAPGMERLAAIDPRKSRVVELRFFGGLSTKEAAEVIHIAPNTVLRDWRMAKAWVHREISHEP